MVVFISESLENYLEAIHMLDGNNHGVRVKDIAEMLDVRLPSVSEALSKLRLLDLVKQEKYGKV